MTDPRTSSEAGPAVPRDCPYDIVLGIDPGTRVVGYGAIIDVPRDPRLLAAGAIRPRGEEMPARLADLRAVRSATTSAEMTEALHRAARVLTERTRRAGPALGCEEDVPPADLRFVLNAVARGYLKHTGIFGRGTQRGGHVRVELTVSVDDSWDEAS